MFKFILGYLLAVLIAFNACLIICPIVDYLGFGQLNIPICIAIGVCSGKVVGNVIY